MDQPTSTLRSGGPGSLVPWDSAWWSPGLAFSEPDGIGEAPGSDVLEGMVWMPLVPFWQVTADLPFSTGVPDGHGHTYKAAYVDGWNAVEIVLNLLAKEQTHRPSSAQAVAQALALVEYSPAAAVGGSPAEASDRLVSPYVNADFVQQIRAVERRGIELDRERGPWDQSVVDARTELAELTGKSGDARGAAALYDRLAQDCRHYFGPHDVRVLDAFEGVARWIGRPGGP
ncbi:alpha/beta-hydrolase family protein [Streptomyces sp. 147326]|uniref:alpha/beta-hydrolase family protein n=1 Tax=Streptomyces sp. 147326 TaxID=3074379 RepID=UPI00385794A0